ncbi:MAG: DUF4340 domain-containing protein [Deltaproteobacteria bacterium]|jgi:hypothetical protein|nr:DUF4340 domain-containing protein [Deltaproteobacteria bacterium]MBW2536459.1 DUF4340 domain-containing protein [Deltaproteobacteria bacterium]
MKELRRLWLHVLLLAVAGALAFVQSRPDEERKRPLEPGEVELWGGSADDITRLVYTGDRKVVTLTAEKDEAGRWYRGSVQPAPEKAEPDEEPADAGADGGRRPHRPKPPPPIEPATFAAVDLAGKLAEKLAPLRAKRTVGEVLPDRLEIYGLDEPEGTLSIEFGERKKELVIGKKTPGGADRYVRVGATGVVYVIDNAIVRDLSGGDVRLSERKLHEWNATEAQQAVVLAGDKERRLVRSGTEGRRFWADAASPDENAETAANWLQKLDRLRPTKYVDELPEAASKFVRVEYRSDDGPIGFVEVYRHIVGEKDEYLVTSERLRMFATVPESLGEQLEEDLASVLP